MENKNNSLKTLFIIVGAIVCVGTAAALLYAFFKKHFKVTFECDGCDCCDGCDEFADDVENYEPICCCEDCEEEAADFIEDEEAPAEA